MAQEQNKYLFCHSNYCQRGDMAIRTINSFFSVVQSLKVPLCILTSSYSVKSWILYFRPSWIFVRFLYLLGLARTGGLADFRSFVEVYGSAKQ